MIPRGVRRVPVLHTFVDGIRSFVELLSCQPLFAGIEKECYLVDPASSHMLVSKIKPCMCKYELIQTVKLRMAH
jgi:hypothetical protein